jgi:putative flippase GtrA
MIVREQGHWVAWKVVPTSLPTSPAALLALARTPEGTKMVRYTLISAICLVISVFTLGVTHGLLHWSAFSANVFACAVGTVPSYELNRKWAWGKQGRGHLLKEVAPFWSLAFIGLAFSTWWAVQAESLAHRHHLTRGVQTVLVEAAVLTAYGILWVGKFIIFNKVLFAHHPEDLEPALDGRTGLPG